LINN
ncbi:hypothetical protein FOXB_00816, partial [Fusarium oxysporum f. sp. conglutinans Fo5176]